MIMVLHELNLAARVADYLIAMKDGQIVSRGSAHEVLTSRNLNDILGSRPRLLIRLVTGAWWWCRIIGLRTLRRRYWTT